MTTLKNTTKSFHLSNADKIELKKISSPSVNKRSATAQPDMTMKVKRSIDHGLRNRWKEGQLITAPIRNWRLSG